MNKGNGGSITVVNPNGISMIVTITQSGGGTPTVYTTEDLSATHTMPKTITATTTFWLAEPNRYTVSVTVNGREIAGTPDGTVTVPLVGGQGFSLEPRIDEWVLTDLSGMFALLGAATNTFTGNVTVGGVLRHNGSTLGFYNTTPASKPAALTATAAAAPAGGTGAAAGAWDTAANRDAAITTINNTKTRLDELEARLRTLGLIT